MPVNNQPPSLEAIVADLERRIRTLETGGLSISTPPNVTGSRGANAALASLLTALANLGIIANNTTA